MPRIGPYILYTIETGALRLDGGGMFGVVPRVLWERRMPPDERGRVHLAMRCLLLEGNGKLILIDNGVGHKSDNRFCDMFGIDHSVNSLEHSLHAHDFSVNDVTDVVLTHLHFDHCGGSTIRRGARILPQFPRATYHVQKEHLAWAQHPNVREKASFLSHNIDPLVASGQLNLLQGEGILFPGVTLMVIHGHTTAQQMVRISGPEGTLIFVADLLPTVHHVRAPWVMAYDVRPLVTLKEKKIFLETAAEENWQIFFEHDPHTIIVGIEKNEHTMVPIHSRPLHELW